MARNAFTIIVCAPLIMSVTSGTNGNFPNPHVDRAVRALARIVYESPTGKTDGTVPRPGAVPSSTLVDGVSHY